MDDIDFRHLRRLWILRLAVETRSIKHAAVRANVTSSAVSQAITGFEAAIGRKLVIRGKDGLAPTPYGRFLLQNAEGAFRSCLDLQHSLATTRAPTPKMTWLDFAADESLAADVLPGLILGLKQRLPRLRLKVTAGRSEALTAAVRKGALCMALVEDNDQLEEVTSMPIAEERLGLFCSPAVLRKHPGAKVFDAVGVGAPSSGSGGHARHVAKFLRTLGKGAKPVLSADSYELLRAAAVQGAVVAVLPTRVACRRPGELVEVFPQRSGVPPRTATYRVHLVSEAACSTAEHAFLARELTALLAGGGAAFEQVQSTESVEFPGRTRASR